MKLNLGPFSEGDIEIGVKPMIGLEAIAFFSRENCIHLGTVRATGPTAATYTSMGGPQIPTKGALGRELICRVTGRGAEGVVGAMTVKLDVILDDAGDDVADTVTATFTVPTWAVDTSNFFPFGVVRDLLPDTPANAGMLVKSVVGLSAVTNQTSGNIFEIFSTPPEASFVEIPGLSTKGLPMDGPASIVIPDRYDPNKWTKLARGELKQVSLSFKNKGGMEQMSRYNGTSGTLRYDMLKEEKVIWERRLLSGFQVQVNPADLGEGNEVQEATATGNFSDAMFGYGVAA